MNSITNNKKVIMRKKNKYSWFLTLLWVSCLLSKLQGGDPYLSNLSATKSSSLYTTYAAAMERSEFILDEGYHFAFYDSSRGIDFTTDTGGDLCLAFKKGSQYVYELKDMYREPVITTSYPDIVKYYYFPFKDIKIDATFLVYSSRVALLDIIIHNLSQQKVVLQVIPFLQNNYRAFNDIKFYPERNAITFTHEELPDGWVLNHNVPYIDKVQDVLLFSQAPDRMTSFRSYRWGIVEIPQKVDIDKKRVYLVWGRVTHNDGERCRHQPPKSRLLAKSNNDKSKILIETAPRWGSTDRNIPGSGFFGIELGNFGDLKKGDTYTVTYLCEESGESGALTVVVEDLNKESSVRKDLNLTETTLPKTPTGLKRDIWGSGTEIRLYWNKIAEDFTYNVYRRDYRKNGVYELIAERLEQNFYTDKNITEDEIYGYVVTAIDAHGKMSMHSKEINNIAGSDFFTDVKYPGQNISYVKDLAKVIAAPMKWELAAGATKHTRIIRAVATVDQARQKIIEDAQKLMAEHLDKYLKANEELYKNIPKLEFNDLDKEMLYWSAFTLMRQVMLPPEEKCSYNYYVFSREPTWGWGHGGQVFHESLTMLAYAFMDPLSAMNSQRVYLERQHANGYINYRTGPYLDETISTERQLTTSAPWYAWQNWEIFKVTGDKQFLKEMYLSSKAFFDFVVSRDSDGDGLCEWGAHAVLESVRDGLVAVWDQVAWPANFEALDLNAMLVQEAKALAHMASALGYPIEAKRWQREAKSRSDKINQTMWDGETGFYYHVDKKDHDFTYENPDDLKREEIIGFLPLWAGIAGEAQAKKLVEKLTDSNKFWRRYGVPSLAADDSYYNPKGYWNGPVWVEWNFLILHGLIQYGYTKEAKELVDRVAANMIAQLKKDHNFWEFYSPDDQWAGYHKTYIWAGIISRMLIDAAQF